MRDMDRYLYSFIARVILLKNGICKNGQFCFDADEEDIKQLYPAYSSDVLPESVLRWIRYGIWDEDMIIEDISSQGK